MCRRIRGSLATLLIAALCTGCALFDLAPERVVLLEGDSLLAYWNSDRHLRGFDVRNRAISGARTADVLARLPGELRGDAPERLVLLVGVNDVQALLGDSAHADRQIADILVERIGLLVRMVDSARVPMLLVGLLPVHGASMNSSRRQNALHRAINERLAQMLPPSGRQEFLDPAPLLRTSSGALDPFLTIDGVHLNAAGYDHIAPAIRAWVDR